MIYEDPVVRHTGDLSITVEFGDEISIDVSYRVLALAQVIDANPIPGLIETIPTHRSIGIVADPLTHGPSRMQAAIRDATKEALTVTRLRSRVVHIPTLYDDPWSRHCAEVHGAPNSIRAIAESTGVVPDEVPRRHSETQHWVGALGFTPGCTQAFPMDEDKVLVGPKYKVPRKWTYPRIIGLGGRLTSPYTVKVPGGYQMLGRTPLDWYDPQMKNPSFGDDIVLCRVGDRQQFEPIDLETYDDIREEVVLGAWEYRIEEGEVTLDQLSRTTTDQVSHD